MSRCEHGVRDFRCYRCDPLTEDEQRDAIDRRINELMAEGWEGNCAVQEVFQESDFDRHFRAWLTVPANVQHLRNLLIP